jgi:hypothetical protein
MEQRESIVHRMIFLISKEMIAFRPYPVIHVPADCPSYEYMLQCLRIWTSLLAGPIKNPGKFSPNDSETVSKERTDTSKSEGSPLSGSSFLLPCFRFSSLHSVENSLRSLAVYYST